jgi:hypothetical protein
MKSIKHGHKMAPNMCVLLSNFIPQLQMHLVRHAYDFVQVETVILNSGIRAVKSGSFIYRSSQSWDKENENGETMQIKLFIRKQNVDWILLGQNRAHLWVLVKAEVTLHAPRKAGTYLPVE